MATFTVEITPDSSNGTIAHAVGKFSGGSSSYKGQRRMDVAVSGVGTFSALSPETSGGENTFSLDITGLTPGTTYNWSASLYYQKTSGSWVTAGSQFDKSGSFTTKSGTPALPSGYTKHKTLVNGTAYEVMGGKCLVNGTVYNILKGRTLIGGTGYDIPFGSNKIKVTITAPKTGYASVTIGGVRYSSAAELEVDPGTAINCVVKGSATNVKGYIYRNGKAVGSSNAYSMTAEKDVSIELTYTTTISGSALIYHGQINITD